VGGRRSYAESKPETVALAKELHGQRLSLSKFAAELAARGHLTASGRPYVASAVQEMSGASRTLPTHQRPSVGQCGPICFRTADVFGRRSRPKSDHPMPHVARNENSGLECLKKNMQLRHAE
jgi:hypothetical protein